jgi:hypothetical protein
MTFDWIDIPEFEDAQIAPNASIDAIRNNILYLQESSGDLVASQWDIPSAVSSFDFQDLPTEDDEYDAYELLCMLRFSGSSSFVNGSLNGDTTGSNYECLWWQSAHTTITNDRITNQPRLFHITVPGTSHFAAAYVMASLWFFNVRDTSRWTIGYSEVIRHWDSQVNQNSSSFVWKNTSVVDQITIYPATAGNWAAGMGAILWGYRYG